MSSLFAVNFKLPVNKNDTGKSACKRKILKQENIQYFVNELKKEEKFCSDHVPSNPVWEIWQQFQYENRNQYAIPLLLQGNV